MMRQLISIFLSSAFVLGSPASPLFLPANVNTNLAPETQTPVPLNLTPKDATKKYIYAFWNGRGEGNKDMKELLGGKAANLAEMSSLGLRVPPGFTITTEATQSYFSGGRMYPKGLQQEIDAYLDGLERVKGKRFGDPNDPLLVAVRSGAKISMPGMMETILNVGLNDQTVEGFARIKNPRAAWDSYRRLIQMFGGTVYDIKKSKFDQVMQRMKEARGVEQDTELSIEDLQEVVKEFKKILQNNGTPFPQHPRQQLTEAIKAVFKSSYGDKANSYRKAEGIPDDVVSAVTVISMVFGNIGENSGTGVLFTRDPNTGENEPYGDYLSNAQGEDVVAGIRTVNKVSNLAKRMPHAWKQLLENKRVLEEHYGDMQDIEFTIEDGVVYMLQTRTGKRGGLAAFQIASDLVEAGMIDKETAILRIDKGHVEQMLYKTFDTTEKKKAIEEEGRLLTQAIGAVPGAASGVIAFSPKSAVRMMEAAAARGDKSFKVILVRPETSPEDVDGMRASAGILTATGGLTSHAAVVARGWGKCCIVGAKELQFEMDDHHNPIRMQVKEKEFYEGDLISLDGSLGQVIQGDLHTMDSEVMIGLTPDEEINAIQDTIAREEARAKRDRARASQKYQLFPKIMGWANEIRAEGVPIGNEKRVLKVRANADEPKDARLARAFGAEGIGLVRTEHMFFKEERINVFRKMIFASLKEDKAAMTAALRKLQEFYEADFYQMLKAMDGYPVIVRLLDPPLHEFLPNGDEKIKEFANENSYTLEEVKSAIVQMHEVNPMLGYRGVRLGVIAEEISAMQFESVLRAKLRLLKDGFDPHPEIEIPFVGDINELKMMRGIFNKVKEKLSKEWNSPSSRDLLARSDLIAKVFKTPFGTMIELPRAALIAEELAEHADFASFGTNDLTQTTLGLSRDDYATFVEAYKKKKIWEDDPFETIDQGGVGQLVRKTVQDMRRKKPKIDIGVCGEHGGDPRSIEFFFDAGLDNVSPSTMRVPIAILTAAQKTIKTKKEIGKKKADTIVFNHGGETKIFFPWDPNYERAQRIRSELKALFQETSCATSI